MIIGKLRHLIDIYEDSETGTGDRGETVTTEVSVYEDVPASVLKLSGRELENSRQLVAEASYKVTVRYHSGLDSTQRVVFGSKVLQIGDINNPEQRNQWLILTCSEV